MSRSNKLVVSSCRSAINQLKTEAAMELGLLSSGSMAGTSGAGADSEFAGELGTNGEAGSHSGSGYSSIQWSGLSTRDAGFVGGSVTKKLIAHAQQLLEG